MNIKYFIIVFGYILQVVSAYTNNLYAIVPDLNDDTLDCGPQNDSKNPLIHESDKKQELELYFQTIRTTTKSREDPFLKYHSKYLELLLGSKLLKDSDEELDDRQPLTKIESSDENEDDLAQYPSGSVLRYGKWISLKKPIIQLITPMKYLHCFVPFCLKYRCDHPSAEQIIPLKETWCRGLNRNCLQRALYVCDDHNKSAVHLPLPELIHRDHCFLKLTDDYMQTAVDAFSIFLEGTLDDVLNLPSSYVLKSARTIAMMHIEREKLAATWIVVKGELEPQEISYQVLEMYRPLFKYLTGREIARLNLSDARILTFIGTHADLDRHQVGVTAAKYIRLNPHWAEPRYLNLMNNLLCGVPMTFMRKIAEANFLQLTQQVFYHIRACDPIQRRFYLSMMTKTQALGKSYSWSARDVARLGLLLTEVKGSDLAAVNPEAMSGITSQVMLEIPSRNLKYITDLQLRYLGQKPLNIFAKKLRKYRERFPVPNSTGKLSLSGFICILRFLSIPLLARNK